ncbi:MAG: OmpA family protein [Proteobacteria bacterium]|nr:MAG: OmpA family protein [Pseudomonadota bacterium]
MNKIASKLALVVTVSTLGLTSCTSPGKRTAIGAGAGVAAGAAVGAIIGHQSGNRGKGAAFGAALGGALGGTIGNRLDKQAKELEKIAETRRTEEGIVTKLKSDILFDTGKSNLKNTQNLQQMAEILKKYPENVLTIKGYTDATGTKQINNPLSKQRADAVRAQLIEGGIPAGTISAMGMGADNPVGDNKTAAGRAQNRRVEIEITVDETKVPANASTTAAPKRAS